MFLCVLMLVKNTQVLQRWQAPSCSAVCCTMICSQPTATWEDCCVIFNHLEQLQEQPDTIKVVEWALDIIVGLAKTAVATQQQTVQQILYTQMHKVPAYARLALLKGGKLCFHGMLALLSSDDQIADSEDSLAHLLACYMQSAMGRKSAPSEIMQLRNQLRYQHLSGLFFAFSLPSFPQLALTMQELSFLVYLRSIRGPVHVLPIHSEPLFPAAWYKAARKLAHACNNSVRNSFELQFNVSESDLSGHLKKAASLRAGGTSSSKLTSGSVQFRGISWTMSLQSLTSGHHLCLAVHPTLVADASAEACNSGIFAEVSFRLDSACPVITATLPPHWFGRGGRGFDNFVQKFGKRPGNPTDLNWWRDYMTDRHVRFSATVKLL